MRRGQEAVGRMSPPVDDLPSLADDAAQHPDDGSCGALRIEHE